MKWEKQYEWVIGIDSICLLKPYDAQKGTSFHPKQLNLVDNDSEPPAPKTHHLVMLKGV
jgi:hypothetical protein